MTIVLGNRLNPPIANSIQNVIDMIPRFTYRKGFDPLNSGKKTDKNWGCCIRCGQSLLSQFVWRYIHEFPDEANSYLNANDFLYHFDDLPDRIFSIHSFCNEIKILGGKPGEWLKVSFLALVIQRLLSRVGVQVIIGENSMISKDMIRNGVAEGRPVLILLPLMLGLRGFDSSFFDFLKVSLSVQQTIGIVGGQQGKAFYLIGYSNDRILYFDPHITQEAVTSPKARNSLFKPPVKVMTETDLNSSLLVGFFIRTYEEVDEIATVLKVCEHNPIIFVDQLPMSDDTDPLDEDEWNIVSLE